MLKLRFANKEHGDVWLVEPSVLMGADAACQVVLKHDGAKPRHTEIQIKGNALTLVNLASDTTLKVNGAPVDKSIAIHVGDTLLLGGMTLLIVDPKDEKKVVADIQPATVWAIRPNHSALANKLYSINGDTVVGRATECDLSFSVSHISRKHAQLSIVNGQLMVKDLDSANGTFVNGKQVQEAKLNKGDELRLDQLSFTVIGPGGDSDKTTMRPAVTATPLSTTTAAVSASRPDTQSVEATPINRPTVTPTQDKKRAAGTTTFYKAVNASEEARQDAIKDITGSKSSVTVTILALVVTVIIVAYIATLFI